MTEPQPPRIEHRHVDKLKPDPRNARTHGPDQIERIANLMERYGFTIPILAGEHIAAGHGRWEAAKLVYARGGALRYPNGAPIPAGHVPIIDCSGWTPEERRAYVLADNAVALQAGWDETILSAELDALAAANFDIADLGFDTAALDDLARGGAGRDRSGDIKDSDFHHEDKFGVIVECADAVEQRVIYERLQAEGLNVKVVVV
jgi:ParB-like chromosome segregation protein Spo0J